MSASGIRAGLTGLHPRAADAAAHDVVVVGGGLVGGTLALALSGAGARVALIEQRPPGGAGAERPIALAESSRRILDTMGLWQSLDPHATPIRRIHVSDRGRFGAVRLEAREHGIAALGQVVSSRALEAGIDAALDSAPLDLLRPARVDSVSVAADRLEAGVRDETGRNAGTLAGRLLVVAEGGGSPLRERLGIPVRRREYGQVALVGTVRATRHHEGTAYERFTPDGPIALLPLADGRMALVWTVPTAAGDALLALPEAPFVAALGAAFGGRLGNFTAVEGRAVFPLALVCAREPTRSRLVVLGGAAHSLHPVAGQGLNLALRDVAALAEAVVAALRTGADPGAAAVLEGYRARRAPDWRLTTAFTDALVLLFSNRVLPLAVLRGLGLLGLDLVPPARRALARRAMGLAGWQSRLARGLAP